MRAGKLNLEAETDKNTGPETVEVKWKTGGGGSLLAADQLCSQYLKGGHPSLGPLRRMPWQENRVSG